MRNILKVQADTKTPIEYSRYAQYVCDPSAQIKLNHFLVEFKLVWGKDDWEERKIMGRWLRVSQ